MTGLGFLVTHPRLDRHFKNFSNLRFMNPKSQIMVSKAGPMEPRIIMSNKNSTIQNFSILSNNKEEMKTDTEEQNFTKLNQSF